MTNGDDAMIGKLLAQDAPSFHLQVWALVVAAMAAVIPIAVAIIVSGLARKQALRDLRSKELVRVHEELIEAISAFGIAALRQNLLFEHNIALQTKCAIARIHAGPQLSERLEGIEQWAARVFDRSRSAIAAIQAGGDGHAEQQSLLEEAGNTLAMVEILATSVTIQLGPAYAESHSWWNDLKVGLLYTLLKARERMSREWQRDRERLARARPMPVVKKPRSQRSQNDVHRAESR